jgi:hypothetical protein
MGAKRFHYPTSRNQYKNVPQISGRILGIGSVNSFEMVSHVLQETHLKGHSSPAHHSIDMPKVCFQSASQLNLGSIPLVALNLTHPN